MTTNQQIAAAFEQAAELLAARSASPSVIDAFRRAARVIGEWPAEVATLADPERTLALGPSLGAAVHELAETGRLGLLERLRAEPLQRARATSGAGSPRERPGVAALLDADAEYRRRAAAGELPRIAPRRFNPNGDAWLPVLRTRREGWDVTALYSNTERAHQLGMTGDWVVLYYERGAGGGQCTVVTEKHGPLRGERVVRGREDEMLGVVR
jgi:DNA polymerase (family X)